jgi:hypothetical protein
LDKSKATRTESLVTHDSNTGNLAEPGELVTKEDGIDVGRKVL